MMKSTFLKRLHVIFWLSVAVYSQEVVNETETRVDSSSPEIPAVETPLSAGNENQVNSFENPEPKEEFSSDDLQATNIELQEESGNVISASDGASPVEDVYVAEDKSVELLPEVSEQPVEIEVQNSTTNVSVVSEDVIAVDIKAEEETIVANLSTSSPGNETAEDEIPSFSEWTQKVLAEEGKSGLNGSTNSAATPPKPGAAPKLRQKNYASPDCGSKILGFNPEAQHASAVLESSRDEYFLSTCSTKIWFVIELCEAVRPSKVEIANFELFSSSPKDFRVFMSDRYPTRDWTLLGQLTAADERSIQSFVFEHQHMFGKFVKVEVDSHYGTEHYCPISLFRVYGTSEYEVLDIDESRNADAADDSTKEDMLEDDLLNSSHGGKIEPTNLSSSIKNAVFSIVKNVVDLVKRDEVEVQKESFVNRTNETSVEVAVPPKSDVCHTATVGNMVVNVTNAINSSLSCQWEELSFLASLSWLRFDPSDECQETNRSFYSPEIEFARIVWSPATMNALCHWIRMSKSKVEIPFDKEAEPVVVFDNETLDLVKELVVEPSSEVVPVDSASEMETLSGLEHLNDTVDVDVEMAPAEMPVAEFKMADGEAKTATPATSASMSTSAVQQKESVFVRLTNRIKVLERNMSLSSQYLEELSRRYKRQVDDMHKSLNRTLKSLNETLQRMAEQDETYKVTLETLQNEIEDLKIYVRTVQEENLVLKSQVIDRHFLLIILEVVAVVAVIFFCLKRFGHREPNRQSVNVTSESAPTPPPPPLVTSPTKATLNFQLEERPKIQELKPLMINIDRDVLDAPSKSSPTPSLAESSSSGCESAFSFPNSAQEGVASRDPSPTQNVRRQSLVPQKVNTGTKGSGKRNKKKRKLSLQQESKASPAKIRLRAENREWHFRAKELAAAFIKENYELMGMRSSL